MAMSTELQERQWKYRHQLGNIARMKVNISNMVSDSLVAVTIANTLLEELDLAKQRAKFSYELDKEKILKKLHSHNIQEQQE